MDLRRLHSLKAVALPAVLSALALSLPSVDSFALRTAPGQLALGASAYIGNDFKGYGIRPAFFTPGGRILGEFGHLFLSAGSSIQGVTIPLEDYGLSIVYEKRIISTVSRSISLYGGAGPFAEVCLVDPKGTLPERVSLSYRRNLFPVGIRGSLSVSAFLTESLSIEGSFTLTADLTGKDPLPFRKAVSLGLMYNFK